MPRIAAAALAALAFLLPAPFTAATAAAGEDGREMVWQGYLHRDGKGRTLLGRPVIAMGVMAQPPHVVAGDPGKRLAPLVCGAEGNWVFWNYELEREGGDALAGLPRALVKLRGKVSVKPAGSRGFDGGERTMTGAKLVSVEFLSDAWLRTWGVVYRTKGSPFRIRDEKKLEGEALADFARAVRDALKKMSELPGATAEQRKLVREIDPAAKIVERFRKGTERRLLRWLEEVDREEELELEGLEDFPPLPPDFRTLQRWFLAAKSRMAFLEKVAGEWEGPLEELTLHHYGKREGATLWARVDLEEVKEGWSDEEFLARQEASRKMLGR